MDAMETITSEGMSELQRELELFEKSEMVEEAEFLSTLRPHTDINPEGEENHPVEITEEIKEEEQPEEAPKAKRKRGRPPKKKRPPPPPRKKIEIEIHEEEKEEENDQDMEKVEEEKAPPSPAIEVGMHEEEEEKVEENESPTPQMEVEEEVEIVEDKSSSLLEEAKEDDEDDGDDEEDVCFVCHDGGELVLCDQSSCPKAYHAACVGRDQAVLQHGQWTCEWHVCSSCEKPASYFCYSCTFSVCNTCIKEADFVCIRENKGFCDHCLQLVLMIEENREESDGVIVDFSDTETWEFLFKEYWLEMKKKIDLTLNEIREANNQHLKGRNNLAEHSESDQTFNENDMAEGSCDSEANDLVDANESVLSKRKKGHRKSSHGKKREKLASREFIGWASKELKEFISHLKQDPEKPLPLFEVQRLLLTYIKENGLQDVRKRSLVNCDERLQKLFGKPKVGQFEMLKLLESHIVSKQLSVVEGNTINENQDPQSSDHSHEDDSKRKGDKTSSERRRKSRKKAEEDTPTRGSLFDYAAINVHNINLVYLSRTLIEDLLEDPSFNEKVVGSFVRIKVPGGNRESCYRIVPVVGTKKTSPPYNIVKKMTDVILEILNLGKREDLRIDTLSTQDFTEEECKRLRQSIRCGLLSRPTVTEVEEKARALHPLRVNYWFETEILKFSHLRDRASEKGLRKELRECVEKLQILSSAEERERKLQEIPEVIADPNETLDQDSEDDNTAEKQRGVQSSKWERGYTKRGWNDFQGSGKSIENDRNYPSSHGQGWESGLNNGGSHVWSSNGNNHKTGNWHSKTNTNKSSELDYKNDDNLWDSNTSPVSRSNENAHGSNNDWPTSNVGMSTSDFKQRQERSQVADDSSNRHINAIQTIDSEKCWHYRDPKGVVQGPFNMLQLKKWKGTGYFPEDLKIWRTNETEDVAILLNNALVGNLQRDSATFMHRGNNDQTFSGHKVSADARHSEGGWANGDPSQDYVGTNGINGWSGPMSRSHSDMPKAPDSSWSGGQAETWDATSRALGEVWGIPQISVNSLSNTRALENPICSTTNWNGNQLLASSGEIPKDVEGAWRGPPTPTGIPSKSMAFETGGQCVPLQPNNGVPTDMVWGSMSNKNAETGSNDAWGRAVNQLGSSFPQISGWNGGLNERRDSSQFSSVEPPKPVNNGWAGFRATDNSWNVASAGEPQRSMDNGWNAVQNPENSWTTSKAVDGNSSATPGWGVAPCQDKSWVTSSLGGRSNLSNGGWVAPQSNEMPWGNVANRNQGWVGGMRSEVGGASEWGRSGIDSTENINRESRSLHSGSINMRNSAFESWSVQKNTHEPESTGKFHSRASNDGSRPNRPKKGTHCKFHAKGFCKRGENCDFLHV